MAKAKKVVYSEPASYFPKSVMKEFQTAEKKSTAKKTTRKTTKKK